jgi:hypothetical protein
MKNKKIIQDLLYEKYKEYKFVKKIKGFYILTKTNQKKVRVLIGVVAIKSRTIDENHDSLNFVKLKYNFTHENLQDINYKKIIQDFKFDAENHFKDIHDSRGNIKFEKVECEFLFFVVEK